MGPQMFRKKKEREIITGNAFIICIHLFFFHINMKGKEERR